MADAPHAIFGTRMNQRREKRGWTWRELGRRSGVSVSMLTGIGAGRSCTLDIAARIARALGTTIDAMLIPASCAQCQDWPPPGYTCQACGAHGKAADHG